MSTFTRIFLNPYRRDAQRLLLNPQVMHAAVQAAFPPGYSPGKGRILWRVDRQKDQHTLYIVAPGKPDAQHIVEQAGWDTSCPDVADYDRFLLQLTKGQNWRFELVANPVVAKSQGKDGRGKLMRHVTPDQQLEWLRKRSENNGFVLLDDATVIGSRRLRFHKRTGTNGRKVVIDTTRFAGTLRVENADALRTNLVQGIGRAKAYGCGLLTLAPVAER